MKKFDYTEEYSEVIGAMIEVLASRSLEKDFRATQTLRQSYKALMRAGLLYLKSRLDLWAARGCPIENGDEKAKQAGMT